MPSDVWKDRKEISFREAEGLTPLPTQLQPKHLSKAMRVRLWELFYSDIRARSLNHTLGSTWSSILYQHHVEVHEQFADDFSDDMEMTRYRLRPLFESAGYGDVLEFVQFVLRHPKCPSGLFGKVSQILEETRSAYRLIETPPTVVPLTSKETVAAVQSALEHTKHGEFSAAHAHLIQASDCLNRGDDSGAIRESIHAVESVAKLIDGNAKSTLGPALKHIESETGALRPALRKSFETLYGYTSDKDGIRHAALKPGDKDVGEDEAIFMYVACAGFVSYLVSKAVKIGRPKQASPDNRN